MPTKVDLNADMGESYGRWTLGDDASLMPHLTSANIACGFHGGDPHVMRRTIALAAEHGVGIGAHVALPDLLGFGRRRLAISADELRDYVTYQSGALRAFADAEGARLQHVKPHGALYTMIVDNEEYSQAVCEAVAALGPEVILLMPPAVGEAAAAVGVPFVPEGYVDLDYDSVGKLVLERVKQVRERRPDGLIETAPGFRSILVSYDPFELSKDDLLEHLQKIHDELKAEREMEIPSRVIRLPVAFDDAQTRQAVQRYIDGIRSDAPNCEGGTNV